MLQKWRSLALLAAASFQSADIAGMSVATADHSAKEAATVTSELNAWERRGECDWWLKGDSSKRHRASISKGDELMMSISDQAFVHWSEDERQLVDLIFDGDPKRQVQVEGWSTHGSDGSGTFGFYLNEATRRYLSEASELRLRHHGQVIIDVTLANLPSDAELDECARSTEKNLSDDE